MKICYTACMVKMQFADPVLEKIVRRWKWARNNTILLFDSAEKKQILDFTSKSIHPTRHTFQPLLFQFQCIVTTTDAYYRKLIGAPDKRYGILIRQGKVMEKEFITEKVIREQLEDQMEMLETILKPYTYEDMNKNIRPILTISDHEYLHQGEILLMFREANIELPPRFSKAWALG